MRTRNQLLRILDDIEADIPTLRRRYPVEDDFLHEIQGMVRYALNAAGIEDQEWIRRRVDTLLSANGIPTSIRMIPTSPRFE